MQLMTESPTEQAAARHDHGGGEPTLCLTAAVERYETPLLRYAGQMLRGDHEYAQDIVQEAFLRLHRQMGNDAMAPPDANSDATNATTITNDKAPGAGAGGRAWLYKVVHNLVIDALRSSRA